jgi:hypothetical protein
MANILMESMGLEKEEKENLTYAIGEQGDLGGFFEQLNEKDQKTYNKQVLNESMYKARAKYKNNDK